MKVYVFSLFCGILLFVHAHAQRETLTADSILQRTIRVAESDSAREARITLIDQFNGKTMRKRGLYSWKQDRLIMSFYDSVNTSFLESRIIEVKDTLWLYRGEQNRVDIFGNNDDPTGLMHHRLFIAGKSGFKPPVLENLEGDTMALISMEPTDPNSKVIKYFQRIDLRTYRCVQQTVCMKSGRIATLVLSYVQINKPIAPEVFEFRESHYPEYLDVIDHRKDVDKK